MASPRTPHTQGGPKRGLPTPDKLYQRMHAAGGLVQLHSLEPDLKKTKLVGKVVQATGLRHDAVHVVHDNLVHCNENGLDYDPLKNYCKGGKVQGPTPRVQSSPGAPERARTALKEAKNQRDAVAEFNRLCEEAGKQPIGEKNHQLVALLAAYGPDGIRAYKRVRRPMVTMVNKKDRASMANVIVTSGRSRRPAGWAPRWSFAKNVICGDQFMVELGSGDLETRWEYLADGALPTPISVVKFPQKLMVNMWVGWNFKSELVWCNKAGSMKGEKTFLREFFKELEKDGGGCLDEYHNDGEACMNCEACYAARDSIGHSFNEVIDSLVLGMVDAGGRPRRYNGVKNKVWMDGATMQWTAESLEYLEQKCKAKRETREQMARGHGEILFSPTHRMKRTPGSCADGCFPDSGVIRHLKSCLRKRLAQVDGGGRQVLCKEEMWTILKEVWDAIPIEDLRPYMTVTEQRWAKIKQTRGSWVGWDKHGVVRHSVGS